LGVWILLAIVLVSLLGGLSLGLYQRMKTASRNIVEALQSTHGSDLAFVSGCGVLSGTNRVPGVLALLRDRIVVRPLAFLPEGELFLHNVVEFRSEDTRTTRVRRARKYRNAQALVFRTDRGEERVFVVEKAHARPWEEALATKGIRPVDRGSAG